MDGLAAYLLLGAAVGFFGGLFGIGGGTLLVPVLLFLFTARHFPAAYAMHLALGTSMATIVFTALSSLYQHHRHGAVNWRVVGTLTPGILAGTAAGTTLAAVISSRTLGVIFAAFVLIASLRVMLDAKTRPSRQLPRPFGLTAAGMFIGGLGAMVSIGGGAIMVPFFVWCNMPLRKAIGTSAAAGFPLAAGGTLGYVLAGMQATSLPGPHLGYVYLPALLGTASASVLAAPLGARLTHRMNVALLRRLFALLLLGLAVKLVLKVL
jgi:uncharacterized protein